MAEPSTEQPGSRSYSRLTIIALAVAVGLSLFMVLRDRPKSPKVIVTLPEFSGSAKRGRKIFNSVCATCHGLNAGGGPGGPALISKAYAPKLHADGAVFLAVTKGVRRHHWNYGNMPRRPEIKPQQIPDITAFIRETQRANGVYKLKPARKR